MLLSNKANHQAVIFCRRKITHEFVEKPDTNVGPVCIGKKSIEMLRWPFFWGVYIILCVTFVFDVFLNAKKLEM